MPKRYYWLKLKENFFEEETIKLMEDMENGKDYVIFLLKLRLKAINTNGYLNFRDIMPYNEKMLATITNTNIDIVKGAIKVFQDIGLMTRMDDGTLYMCQVEELTGSETPQAQRTREYRDRLQELPEKASHGDDGVTNCDTDIEIEKEKEKDSTSSENYFSDDSLEMKMTDYMIEKVKEFYPAAKVPDTVMKKHKWCKNFDLLMRVDGKSKNEIREVMQWIYQDDFWATNIRSPSKLREKWDTVYLKMKREQKKMQEPANEPGEFSLAWKKLPGVE